MLPWVVAEQFLHYSWPGLASLLGHRPPSQPRGALFFFRFGPCLQTLPWVVAEQFLHSSWPGLASLFGHRPLSQPRGALFFFRFGHCLQKLGSNRPEFQTTTCEQTLTRRSVPILHGIIWLKRPSKLSNSSVRRHIPTVLRKLHQN